MLKKIIDMINIINKIDLIAIIIGLIFIFPCVFLILKHIISNGANFNF